MAGDLISTILAKKKKTEQEMIDISETEEIIEIDSDDHKKPAAVDNINIGKIQEDNKVKETATGSESIDAEGSKISKIVASIKKEIEGELPGPVNNPYGRYMSKRECDY